MDKLIIEHFPRIVNGKRMGCKDGPHPEMMDSHSLSRLYDALQAIETTCGTSDAMKVWDSLPFKARMDFGWSRWVYQARAQ